MIEPLAPDLLALHRDFWRWRALTAPDTYDDLFRFDRPPGWRPDWSADAIAERRGALAEFVARHRNLSAPRSVAAEVDQRLVGCALARARWELDTLRGWQRNPYFYVEQAIGPLYALLLVRDSFDAARADQIIILLEQIPRTLADARVNLQGTAAAPFTRYAVRMLGPVEDRMTACAKALAAAFPAERVPRLSAAAAAATEALVAYRDWLTETPPDGTEATAVGAAALASLLYTVALLPYSIPRLRDMAAQEWHRVVATETILRHRHRDLPDDPLFPDAAAQVAGEYRDELAVRDHYTGHDLLTQPETLRHYRFQEMPDYLAPLTWLGVCHDPASQARMDADAVRYISDPAPDLPYFEAAKARDPRTAIAHEGVHAQQLALSWRHPDPIRRTPFDSVPNEGIANYNEELFLLSGLFDDRPHSALFHVNSMRLRALRVEIDIDLAVGAITVDEAADRLARRVPLDSATAWQEAVFFASNPGQGLSYQAGRWQILELLSDCSRRPEFDIHAFHDRLWREGNVPIALQRLELLGSRDHLNAADRLAASGTEA
ncbi:DUF885 family protein [Nocardia arthritidis]|uniref:DUF885 family protein n=1 Tax=Nocardia arthritidis TaxID=228602 RepID=A0A6G9YEX3_9NOCA|nr:DUF885 family protein [Nocardia arthritidis]QIS11627.1 DUF885 family protein [Nocardia arthritidis]